ncbi:hypothetical protein ADUPG1_000677 [Aduncisulcus paluster]|uniref:Reverse transcriptase domain-containing protein n=1 Tax=Aduncisulcus paluster TaxID=2918883 RepID=A0ABQ5K974_9EUKA|nr:hypothetical protein ADUPG1_000677 [Aduncisulcus paluster]
MLFNDRKDELQLGVMCDGGAETVLNSIYAAAEVGRRQGKKVYTVALDFANAFNTVLPKAVIAAIHRLNMDGKIKNAVLSGEVVCRELDPLEQSIITNKLAHSNIV